jgi:hypothetical protein
LSVPRGDGGQAERRDAELVRDGVEQDVPDDVLDRREVAVAEFAVWDGRTEQHVDKDRQHEGLDVRLQLHAAAVRAGPAHPLGDLLDLRLDRPLDQSLHAVKDVGRLHRTHPERPRGRGPVSERGHIQVCHVLVVAEHMVEDAERDAEVTGGGKRGVEHRQPFHR